VVGDVDTEDWELFDITHTVLPTKMPLDEFYDQLAGLWRHTMDVRYAVNGRLKVHLGILAALATGKVTLSAMRKGMRMGTVLGRAETFLKAHRESPGRLREASSLLA
jgi:hypothetical protein